ncbi:hypothetical protein G6F43_009038 [Rhizopus delemar]|nr:hypothetical protein G6F43_009038 [Rhizopus delemar]
MFIHFRILSLGEGQVLQHFHHPIAKQDTSSIFKQIVPSLRNHIEHPYIDYSTTGTLQRQLYWPTEYDITQQHFNTHERIPLNDGPCRYLEVYSSKQHSSYDVVNNSLIILMLNYQFFLAALQGLAKIVTLRLNRLPLLPKTEGLTGLKKSHAVFDVIMDLGINAAFVKR